MHIEEYSGSGFIPGIPASMATAPCRIKFGDSLEILEVVAPGQPFSDEMPPASPDTSAQQSTPKRAANGEKG